LIKRNWKGKITLQGTMVYLKRLLRLKMKMNPPKRLLILRRKMKTMKVKMMLS